MGAGDFCDVCSKRGCALDCLVGDFVSTRDRLVEGLLGPDPEEDEDDDADL